MVNFELHMVVSRLMTLQVNSLNACLVAHIIQTDVDDVQDFCSSIAKRQLHKIGDHFHLAAKDIGALSIHLFTDELHRGKLQSLIADC